MTHNFGRRLYPRDQARVRRSNRRRRRRRDHKPVATEPETRLPPFPARLETARSCPPLGPEHPVDRPERPRACRLAQRLRYVLSRLGAAKTSVRGGPHRKQLRRGRRILPPGPPEGALIATPFARLEHRPSPVNRYPASRWYTAEVVARHWRVRRFPQRLSRTAFWWSVAGELTLALAKSLVRLKRSPLVQARAIAIASGPSSPTTAEWSTDERRRDHPDRRTRRRLGSVPPIARGPDGAAWRDTCGLREPR